MPFAQPPAVVAAFLVVAAAMAVPSVVAEPIGLFGGRVHTMAGTTHEHGYVIIEDGVITEVGDPEAIPSMLYDRTRGRSIDVTGMDVYPGWVAGHTQLGLVEIDAVSSVNDISESTAISNPQVRAIDAINPESSLMAVSRMAGVTTAVVAPGGRVVTGQGAMITLGGGSLEEVLVASPVALYVNLGEPARTGESKKPQTRMGVMGVLREEFIAAAEYRAKRARHAEELARWEAKRDRLAARRAALEAEGAALSAEGKEEEADAKRKEAADVDDAGLPPMPPSRDLAKEPLVEALEGKLLVVARAHRLDDIETAVRLAEEFGLRLAIVGGANAWRMADVLAAKGIPVLLRTTENPSTMETQGARYSAAARLHAAGVPFAIIPEDNAHNVRNLPWEAGLAVTYGLPREAALEAITVAPARIFGVADRVGSIEVGKMANLVVVEGDPLQPTSRVRHVFIAGREMEMTSRQTGLAAPFLAGAAAAAADGGGE